MNRRKIMTTYFGFALAAGMFSGDGNVTFRQASVEEAQTIVADAMEKGTLQSCLNPSHTPTIEAMRSRYGFDVPVPEKAPFANLQTGDSLVVMGVRGLPRLEGRHEYTEEEIASATFTFSVWNRTE
jgi:hypothetical protein